jgi:hypothetical protein
MNCSHVQLNLSLYLYGELEFAEEEQVEQHLETCAACQLALAREKEWHARTRSAQPDVSLGLLADCRRDLRLAIKSEGSRRFRFPRLHWPENFRLAGSRLSGQMALASFLLFLGFGAGRLVDRFGVPGLGGPNGLGSMALLDAGDAHVRQLQPSGDNRINIVIEQVRQHEITGSLQDSSVRQLVLSAVHDPADPALRMDSVSILDNQDGADVLDALTYAVRHDPNAAVRLKALEGLRRFPYNVATRDCLRFVLEHDASADVRSEAIDVLASDRQGDHTGPDLADMLGQIATSPQQDEYVRLRALQLLKSLNSPPVY